MLFRSVISLRSLSPLLLYLPLSTILCLSTTSSLYSLAFSPSFSTPNLPPSLYRSPLSPSLISSPLHLSQLSLTIPSLDIPAIEAQTIGSGLQTRHTIHFSTTPIVIHQSPSELYASARTVGCIETMACLYPRTAKHTSSTAAARRYCTTQTTYRPSLTILKLTATHLRPRSSHITLDCCATCDAAVTNMCERGQLT